MIKDKIDPKKEEIEVSVNNILEKGFEENIQFFLLNSIKKENFQSYFNFLSETLMEKNKEELRLKLKTAVLNICENNQNYNENIKIIEALLSTKIITDNFGWIPNIFDFCKPKTQIALEEALEKQKNLQKYEMENQESCKKSLNNLSHSLSKND